MKKFVVFILLSFFFVGCWPTSISFQDAGSMPAEWKSFSILPIQNNAPNAPISYPTQLSEDLRDGIQNNTRLKLSSQSNGGEIRIEGIVTNYTVTPIALQPGDNAAKNRLTIQTSYTFYITHPKAEEMTLSCSRFADFPSSTDINSVEKELINDINKQTVQDVINKLLSNW